MRAYLAGRQAVEYGRWVHYPWSARLVHVLPHAQLGLPKTALTARQLVEINPYLDLELFPAGVSTDNIEEFLTGGRPLDLLIEESDSWRSPRRRAHRGGHRPVDRWRPLMLTRYGDSPHWARSRRRDTMPSPGHCAGERTLTKLVSVAEIVSAGSTHPNALAAFITERVTNRKRDGAGVLSHSQSAALIAAA